MLPTSAFRSLYGSATIYEPYDRGKHARVHPRDASERLHDKEAFPTMLRNDLITLLAEKGNDAVTVSINGALVDADSVAARDGSIVLVLDPEDLRDTFKQLGPVMRDAD